jgi:cold shock protein
MDIDNTIRRIVANVKWYNTNKGYGFVECEGIDDDIFLHFSALDKAGFSHLNDGDEVLCEINECSRGLQVIKIIEVKLNNNSNNYLKQKEFGSRIASYDPYVFEIAGEIKWYNPTKGYGFIYPYDNGVDIFFHAYVLNQSGYDLIDTGVQVEIKAVNTKKGREAREIRIIQ